MRSESAFIDILRIDDNVRFQNSRVGGVLELPSGRQVPLNDLQWKILCEFRRPTTALRLLAMAASDQERAVITTNLERWLDLGILQPSEMRHGSDPVVTLTNPQSNNLFFIYAGSQGGMMMNPFQFLQESGLSGQNIVLLRDPYQTWFLNGLGDRVGGVSELAAWQAGYLRGQPHVTHHYCVGSSMGAFSAVLFGHLLKATAVWAFGLARTTVSLFDGSERSWNLETMLDQGNGATRFYLYFNNSWTEDREAASRLRNQPGVELRPQNGEGHLVLETLQNAGLISSIFPQTPSPRHQAAPRKGAPATEREVLKVLQSVLPEQNRDIEVTTRLDGILDSFGLVLLLEGLRDLGIDLDPACLNANDFESATTIARAVARELGTGYLQ